MFEVVECPVCSKHIDKNKINMHLDFGCRKSISKVQPTVGTKRTFAQTGDTNVGELHKAANVSLSTSVIDLDSNARSVKRGNKSLPEMMRPTNIDQLVGQSVFDPNSPIRSFINSESLPNILLQGPPGTGKTSIARILAKTQGWHREFTASECSVSDIKAAAEDAVQYLKATGKRGVIFVDEIHRLSKSQQDVFNTALEKGTYTLIGATTENLSFRLNSALLSRSRVFVLQQLDAKDLLKILEAARLKMGLMLSDTVLQFIADVSGGDARICLNNLEYVSKLINPNVDTVKKYVLKSHTLSDRNGDYHYDMISALHKSVRGSDENAALYWLHRMLDGGQDILYIARRLVRMASEDIGLANNEALTLATSTFQSCQLLGMPESDIILSHCVVYLARSPKSVECYQAMKQVKEVISREPSYDVPMHLRNATSKLSVEQGHGVGYKYNPEYIGPVKQEYLPSALKTRNFFTFKPDREP